MQSKRPRVLFLGSRPLGKKALGFLCEQPDIELIGKVTLPDYTENYWDEDPADLDFPPTFSADDLAELDFDLGISVNYWKLVKPQLLAKPRLGFFNIHHSYNLSYRGLNMSTFAILCARERRQFYHGTTLHKMSPTADAGEIVASYSCAIEENDTAFSLFKKVETLSERLIEEWFPRLWRERIVTATPSDDFAYFTRRQMVPHEVRANWPALRIYDHVRALTFPPFEAPYFRRGDCRHHLTIDPGKGGDLFVDAGESRCVYELRR